MAINCGKRTWADVIDASGLGEDCKKLISPTFPAALERFMKDLEHFGQGLLLIIGACEVGSLSFVVNRVIEVSHLLCHRIFVHVTPDSGGNFAGKQNDQAGKESSQQTLRLLDSAVASKEANNHHDSTNSDQNVDTDVEGAGGLSSVKLDAEQAAGFLVMPQPQSHTQDYTSCKPKDEVEEEEQVLDTFGAAFDSHDGAGGDGGAEICEDMRS